MAVAQRADRGGQGREQGARPHPDRRPLADRNRRARGGAPVAARHGHRAAAVPRRRPAGGPAAGWPSATGRAAATRWAAAGAGPRADPEPVRGQPAAAVRPGVARAAADAAGDDRLGALLPRPARPSVHRGRPGPRDRRLAGRGAARARLLGPLPVVAARRPVEGGVHGAAQGARCAPQSRAARRGRHLEPRAVPAGELHRRLSRLPAADRGGGQHGLARP